MGTTDNHFNCRLKIVRCGSDYGVDRPQLTSTVRLFITASENYRFSAGTAPEDTYQMKNLMPGHISCTFGTDYITLDAGGPCQVEARETSGKTSRDLVAGEQMQIAFNRYGAAVDWKIIFPNQSNISVRLRSEKEFLEKESMAYLESHYGELKKIQETGSCIIYRTGDDRVLKVFRPAMAANKKSILRFINAARKFQQMHTPLFLKIQGIGYKRALNLCFVVTNYFEGETLSSYLAKKGTLPAEEATRIVKGIAERLIILQKHRTCLRNLAPDNILIAPDGEICITGFFLVKSDVQLTGENTQMIRAGYTAPEQIKDPSKVGVQADVFSLGAIYHTLLFGEPPLPSDNAFEYTEKLMNSEAPTAETIQQLCADMPLNVCRVVSAMIASMPQRRPNPQRLRTVLAGKKKSASKQKKVRAVARPTAGIQIMATGISEQENNKLEFTDEKVANFTKTIRNRKKELTEENLEYIEELKISGVADASEPEWLPASSPRVRPRKDMSIERVGFGARFCAAFIDGFLQVACSWGLGYMLASVFVGSGDLIHAVAFMFVGAYLGCVFYGTIEGFVGASPGKMIMNLKIGYEDGIPASHDQYMKRYLIKNSAFWFMLIATTIGVSESLSKPVVGLWALILFFGCFLIFSQSRQCLWDKMSQTAIYNLDALNATDSKITCNSCNHTFTIRQGKKSGTKCPQCNFRIKLVQFSQHRKPGVWSYSVFGLLLILSTTTIYQTREGIRQFENNYKVVKSKGKNEIFEFLNKGNSKNKKENKGPEKDKDQLAFEKLYVRNAISYKDQRGLIIECEKFLQKYPYSSHRRHIRDKKKKLEGKLYTAARMRYAAIENDLRSAKLVEAWQKIQKFPNDLKYVPYGNGRQYGHIIVANNKKIMQKVAERLKSECSELRKAQSTLKLPKISHVNEWRKTSFVYNDWYRRPQLNQLFQQHEKLQSLAQKKHHKIQNMFVDFFREYQRQMKAYQYQSAAKHLKSFTRTFDDQGIDSSHSYHITLAVLTLENKAITALYQQATDALEKSRSYTVCRDRRGKEYKGSIVKFDNGIIHFRTLKNKTIQCPLTMLSYKDLLRYVPDKNDKDVYLALTALYSYDGDKAKAKSSFEKIRGKIPHEATFYKLYLENQ